MGTFHKRFKVTEDMKQPIVSQSATKLQNLASIDDISGVKVEFQGKISSVKDIEEVKAKDGMYKKQECVWPKSDRLVVWEAVAELGPD